MNYKGHHALLIGVSDYAPASGWADRKNIASELDALQLVLTESGFQVTRVNNPNKRGLEDAFRNFIDAYGYEPDHRLFFYFAGHGHSKKIGSKIRGFLVPADAPHPSDETEFMRRTLQMTRILSWSKEMTARHAIFLFDACFSDAVLEGAFPKQSPQITKLTSLPVRQYLAAGRHNEKVPAQSVFAKWLVSGLKGGADKNKDGYILGTELGLYIKGRMADDKAGATPQIGKIRDSDLDRGEFVFRTRSSQKSEAALMPPLKPGMVQAPSVVPSSTDSEARVDQIVAQLAALDKQKQQALAMGYLAESRKVKQIDTARMDYLSRHGTFLKARLSEVELSYASLNKQMRADAVPVLRLKQRLDQLNRIISPTIGGRVGHFVMNSLGMKLMYIPATTSTAWKKLSGGKDYFLMGSAFGDRTRFDDEGQHKVRLTRSFYMSSTEVTQAQWQKVMGNNPSWFKGANRPVEKVSWNDAMAFCIKYSKQQNQAYRLPTEAEWEYACRAGKATRFSFGGAYADLHRFGNYLESSNTVDFLKKDKNYQDGHDKTAPVGGYKPNPWGLYDMHGNVWEWCLTRWSSYPDGIVTDPLGAKHGELRSTRGGSWSSAPRHCRSARRGRLADIARDSRVGFRVVLVQR